MSGLCSSFVVLDTSVYLHYRFFADVNWGEIVETPSPILLVPSQVAVEIDKTKDQHPLRRRRERARRVSKAWLDARENSGKLPSGLHLQFHRARADRSLYEQYNLSESVPDDIVVASILQFRHDNPDSNVLLLATDANMRMTAEDVGITVLAPPPELEDSDEPDELENELRESQRRVRALEQRRPSLSLNFTNGENWAAVEPTPLVVLTEEIRQQILAKKMRERPPVGRLSMPNRDQSDMRRYAQEHAEYYDDIIVYLDVLSDWYERESRVVRIPQIQLTCGTFVPAKRASVELCFPPGISIETDDSRPTPPSEPEPPKLPAEYSALIFIGSGRPRFAASFGLSNDARSELVLGVASIKSMFESIEGSIHNGVTYKRSVPTLQNAMMEELPTLYAVFDAAISSFSIQYTLRADEMAPVSGHLHVKVQR